MPVKVAVEFEQQQVFFGIVASSAFRVEVVLVAARIENRILAAFLHATSF